MEQSEYEQLLKRTERLKDKLDHKLAKSLELDLLQRIILRLQSFDCAVCTGYLPELSAHVAYFEENDQPDRQAVKAYRKTIEAIKSHLQKAHQIVPEALFMSIYMSVGMSLGVALGLSLLDNLALGLPIGMSMGLAIGAALDADAKKKGRTL